MTKTVVFDVGNVLLDWNPRYLYRKLLPTEDEVEHFLNHICTAAWNAEQDRGRPWRKAVDELSERYPEHANLIRAFDERWHETLSGPIQGTVEVLRELAAADVPLYALTNFSAEKFDEVCEIYDFFALFRGIVVSGTERLIKPDPAIFRTLLERFPFAPQQAIFIDDSLHNLEAASQFGMNTIHFTSPSALRARLRELELPV